MQTTGHLTGHHSAGTSPFPAFESELDPQVRHRMIAEAAYFRAEARDFISGFDVEDWLEAEAEVDQSRIPSELRSLCG